MTDKLLWRGDFARVWWGGLINALGTWMTMAALPVYVYAATQSVPAASAMFLASTLPGVLLGSSAGLIADRFDRRSLLIITNLLAALSLIPLLFVGSQGLWVVYLSAALKAIVTLPTGPARAALLPALVPESQLARANALNALNGNIARLVGPAVGGGLLASTNLSTVVLIDAATYVVAAVFLATVTRRPVANPPREAPLVALAAGVRAVRGSFALATLVLTMAITSVGEGVFGVLLAPFVTSVVEGDARVFGLVLSAQAVGGIVGGALIAKVASRVPPLRLWTLGMLGLGLVDLVIFLYPLVWSSVWPVVALMVVAGLPASASGAGWMTLAQRFSKDEMRGRVFGLAGQLAGVGVLIGVGVASIADTKESIVALLCVHGVLLMMGGAAAALLWTARRLDAASAAQAATSTP